MKKSLIYLSVLLSIACSKQVTQPINTLQAYSNSKITNQFNIASGDNLVFEYNNDFTATNDSVFNNLNLHDRLIWQIPLGSKSFSISEDDLNSTTFAFFRTYLGNTLGPFTKATGYIKGTQNDDGSWYIEGVITFTESNFTAIVDITGTYNTQ